MSKHLLLPERYGDASMKSSILFALKPYTLTQQEDVANPQMKWNLTKAWQEAQILLAKSHWQHDGDEQSTAPEITEYELSADNDEEIETLNTIIAGLVACEILDPDSGIFIRRIAHRKGGEMAVAIAPSVVEVLKKRFPGARYTGHILKEKNENH